MKKSTSNSFQLFLIVIVPMLFLSILTGCRNKQDIRTQKELLSPIVEAYSTDKGILLVMDQGMKLVPIVPGQKDYTFIYFLRNINFEIVKKEGSIYVVFNGVSLKAKNQ
jgi:hypothetical protein